MRQFGMDEFARDREDQVGLEQRINDALSMIASKFGNVSPLVGSVNGASGGCTLLPEKSTHSRKWAISSPPIPRVISQHFGARHLLAE